MLQALHNLEDIRMAWICALAFTVFAVYLYVVNGIHLFRGTPVDKVGVVIAIILTAIGFFCWKRIIQQ